MKSKELAISDGGIRHTASWTKVYLDFDGATTSYCNRDLNLNIDVTVEDSRLDSERIYAIVSELNERYADQQIVFVSDLSDLSADSPYSTIYVGKTSAFDEYGTFDGISETVDLHNSDPSDNAYILLDAKSDSGKIISVIQHEIGHIIFGEKHAVITNTLADYADISPLLLLPNVSYTDLKSKWINGTIDLNQNKIALGGTFATDVILSPYTLNYSGSFGSQLCKLTLSPGEIAVITISIESYTGGMLYAAKDLSVFAFWTEKETPLAAYESIFYNASYHPDYQYCRIDKEKGVFYLQYNPHAPTVYLHIGGLLDKINKFYDYGMQFSIVTELYGDVTPPAITDITAPEVDNVQSTASCENADITIQATDVSAIKKYTVKYWYFDSAGGRIENTQTSTTDIVTLNSLKTGTRYYYQVSVEDEYNNASAYSTEYQFQTSVDSINPVFAGTGFSYTPTGSNITLRWDAATDNASVARYEITFNGKKYTSTTNSVRIDTPAGNYSYSVIAYDSTGNFSEAHGGTTQAYAVTGNVSEGGALSGKGTYFKGTEITLKAVSDPHFLLTGFMVDNVAIQGNSTKHTIVSDTSVSATFRPMEQYSVTVGSNLAQGAECVTVTGTDMVAGKNNCYYET